MIPHTVCLVKSAKMTRLDILTSIPYASRLEIFPHQLLTLSKSIETMDRSKSLIDVKTALAEKYERQAAITKSQPKRIQFAHKATRYRRQIEQLKRA